MVKAPSFKSFTPSSIQASRHLSKIKSVDNRGERMLRSTLWKMGLRFRKHVRTIPGIPDIVFSRQRLVVFCDGDFWHGRKWREDKRRLRTGPNPQYWLEKIEANMNRDKCRTKQLREMGWSVVRVWDSDVRMNPEREAHKVIQALTKESAAGS
ncbi:MAG: very short patch repair endonuclease [Pyrinomonadaceae bacterium]